MLENKQCPLSDVIHAHNVYICIMYVFTSTWTCHMVYTYRITSFTVTCRLNIVKCGGDVQCAWCQCCDFVLLLLTLDSFCK